MMSALVILHKPHTRLPYLYLLSTRLRLLSRPFQQGGSTALAVDSESTSRCCSVWDEELEVQDGGAQDTIEIALDLEPK